MEFKISLILLHFLFATLSIGANASNSVNAFASAINDSEYQSQMHRLPTMTTTATISADTCTAPHCDNLMRNNTESAGRAHTKHHDELIQSTKAVANTNSTAEVMTRLFSQQFMQSDRLISSSIIYGLLSLAAQKGDGGQCFSELNQIYEGIQRKEIWAVKGTNRLFLFNKYRIINDCISSNKTNNQLNIPIIHTTQYTVVQSAKIAKSNTNVLISPLGFIFAECLFRDWDGRIIIII